MRISTITSDATVHIHRRGSTVRSCDAIDARRRRVTCDSYVVVVALLQLLRVFHFDAVEFFVIIIAFVSIVVVLVVSGLNERRTEIK